MKRSCTSILLLTVWLSVSLPAQQASRLSDRYQAADKSRHELWQAKKYGEAVALLRPFYESGEYIDLSEAERQGLLYNMACGYSLLGDKAKALDFLIQALAAGYRDYANASRDSDFAGLRGDPAFEALLAKLKKIGDYGQILVNYAAYKAQPDLTLPAFQYQAPEAEKLAELRRTYKLDEVAGAGDDVSRIIALMRWVHKAARHDGTSQNPEPRNALHILQVCRDEKRGVNCRMLATVLNEACLAMGFKSRHVTCLPKYANDPDCHVINMVYVPSLGKWVYMDPSFEAYFEDGKGGLMSIAEVRQALASGRTPKVAKGINWNGQPRQEDWYLGYMSKNLFRFSCPGSSEFGYESKPGAHQYIVLEPEGFAAPANSEKDIHITDSGRFWALPEGVR